MCTAVANVCMHACVLERVVEQWSYVSLCDDTVSPHHSTMPNVMPSSTWWTQQTGKGWRSPRKLLVSHILLSVS